MSDKKHPVNKPTEKKVEEVPTSLEEVLSFKDQTRHDTHFSPSWFENLTVKVSKRHSVKLVMGHFNESREVF